MIETMDVSSGHMEESSLLSTDSKFRSYASSMDKALKAFEGSGEWADLINSLTKMQKVLQSYSAKYTIIPRKALVAKRLAQVLHPALPSGVHLKALEIYHTIFTVIGQRGLSEDLFLYSTGLFPLLASCSMSTKPKVLELYENFYVPLGDALKPAMPALLHGVLPGLEEGSEYFYPTLRLLENFRSKTSNFSFAMWKCLLDNSSTRFQGLTFIMEVHSKTSANKTAALSGSSKDTVFIESDIMIKALCECLQDSSVLVQRIALDLAINLTGNSQRAIPVSISNLVSLNCSALAVLLRKDLSLNRRLYSWMFDQNDNIANESVFLDSLNSFIVITEKMVLQADDKNFNRNLMLRPLRVLNTLLDSKADMSLMLMSQNGGVLTTLFRYLLSLTAAMLGINSQEMYNRMLGNSTSVTSHKLLSNLLLDNRASGDLIKSANVLFQEIQKRESEDLIWRFFATQLDVCCAGSTVTSATSIVDLPNKKMTVSELCQFVSFFLDIILLESHENAFECHIPKFLHKVTTWLWTNCDSLSLSDINDSLKLSVKLIAYVHPSACYVAHYSNGNPTTDGFGKQFQRDLLVDNLNVQQPFSSKSSVTSDLDDLTDPSVKKLKALTRQDMLSDTGESEVRGGSPNQPPLSNGIHHEEEELMRNVNSPLRSDTTVDHANIDVRISPMPDLDNLDVPTSPPPEASTIHNSSVVEACISSIKSFFHKLLCSKLFEPSLKAADDRQAYERVMKHYSQYLLQTYTDMSLFRKIVSHRLETWNSSGHGDRTSDSAMAMSWSSPPPKLSVSESCQQEFLKVFDLSCKLLHAICTLPVNKDTDIVKEKSGSEVEIPAWLMSLFICSCFVSDFSIQTKSIDCLLQQLALSSAAEAEIMYSSDQRIIASISPNQLHLINKSYHLYLEICLSLWSWLESRFFLSHEKAVDLWLQLHRCCPAPIRDLCEDVVVHCMQQTSPLKSSEGLEACRRFAVIWHLSRTINYVHNLIAAGQPTFDRCLLVMLDGLSAFESARRSVARQWLLHCISREDLARILEPILLVLLHHKTSRLVPQEVFVMPLHSLPNYAEGASRQLFSVILQRRKDDSFELSVMPKQNGDLPKVATALSLGKSSSVSSMSNPFAFSGAVFMSEVEREMMIDSEDFEELDVQMLVRLLLNEIVQEAMDIADADHDEEHKEPPANVETYAETVEDSKEQTLKRSESLRSKKGPVEALQASIKSTLTATITRSVEQITASCSSNEDVSRAAAKSGSVSHLDDVFLSFFLIYNEQYDFKRCQHAFKLLSDMLKVDPKVFIKSLCSTFLGCGNTPYVHQLPTFIARHNNAIEGKNFFGDIAPESLAPFRSAMFLELLIELSLHHMRSTFSEDAAFENSSVSLKEARVQNQAIQVQACELMTEMFEGLNQLLESGAQDDLPVLINDLMLRCHVQRTVLLCLLCHVRTDVFAMSTFRSRTEEIDANDSAATLDYNCLEIKLLELIAVLIQTEFYVFVPRDRQKFKTGPTLLKDATSRIQKQKKHALLDASFRYNSDELIVCQNFFVEIIVDALKQTNFLSLQPYWLNFVITVLPYTCKARREIVVPVVNQICRNLEILSEEGVTLTSVSKVNFLPPDILITLLDNLSNFFKICTMEKHEEVPVIYSGHLNHVRDAPSNTDTSGSPLKGWAVEDSVEESKSVPPILQPVTVKKDFWLDAKKGTLDILPRVLSCLLRVWKRVDKNRNDRHDLYAKSQIGCSNSASGSSLSSNFVMGQPTIVRQHIVDIIQSLSITHSSKLYAAVALVWNGHREKNKLRKLKEHFVSDQKLLVTLINSIPSQNLTTIVSNVSQVLKFSSPYIQVKKQPIMEISILQFFYAHIQTLSTTILENNSKLILNMVRDSIQNTAHGGQVILLLIANYVIEKIITEMKDMRELQDLVSRLTEVLSQLAGSGLTQSAWIGRIYTVKPGIQIPSDETDLILLQGNPEWEQIRSSFAGQPVSCLYVQATEVLADVLPNLLDLIYRSEEKEKINSVIQNAFVVAIAYLKTRSIENIPCLRAASRFVAEFSYFHYTRKSWKRDIFDIFLEKSFFQMTAEMVSVWKVVIDNLMTHDKFTFKEFLGQGNIAGLTGGLIKSKESELELKAKLLKRLAFVVFASEKDQYNRILPELQERVSEMLKSGGSSPVVLEQIFLVFRIFLIRLNQDSLIALWPIMISELTVQLKQLELDLMSEAGKVNHPNGTLTGSGSSGLSESWLAMYLSMAKFLDTALLLGRMSLSHFQTYLWAFVGISPDEKNPNDNPSRANPNFTPYCIKIAQLLEDRLTSKQLSNKTLPVHFGYPLLHFQYYKITNISQLQPFFSTICNQQLNNRSGSILSEDEPQVSKVPKYSEEVRLKSADDSKSYSQNLRKKLLHISNLHLSRATDAADFLEKLIERDFSEMMC